MHDLDTEAAPAVGTILRVNGRGFVCVAVEDYTRKRDLAVVPLMTWETDCATCGMPFRFKRGLVAKGISYRCKDHAKPGRPATDAARDALRDARRRGTATMKANAKRDRRLKALGLL